MRLDGHTLLALLVLILNTNFNQRIKLYKIFIFTLIPIYFNLNCYEGEGYLKKNYEVNSI